jgi:hypothetical protein
VWEEYRCVLLPGQCWVVLKWLMQIGSCLIKWCYLVQLQYEEYW